MAATNHWDYLFDVNVDLEDARPNCQEPSGSESQYSCNKVLLLGKYALFLVAIVATTAIIAALGVLTAPVSAVLLLVSLFTYCLTRPIQSLHYFKLQYVIWRIMVSFRLVVLLLFLPLIIMLPTFRLVPSLKSKAIGGMEVWKWLEICLVSCLFGTIWIGGSYLSTHVKYERKEKENLVYFVNASRSAVNCICIFGGELLVLKVAPGPPDKVLIYGLPTWKWIAVIDLIIFACYLIRIITRSITVLLDVYQQHVVGGAGGDGRSQYGVIVMKNMRSRKIKNMRYVAYMAKGLRESIDIVLFMVLILLTWAFYVNDRLDLDRSTDDAKTFLRYAKGTFLALLVGSVLWVIKNFLVLLWTARQVYKRHADKMLEAWTQLYFIVLIFQLNTAAADLVNDWNIFGDRACDSWLEIEKASSNRGSYREDGKHGRSKKGGAKKELPTYDILHRMSRSFEAACELLSDEKDNESADTNLSEIRQFLKRWKRQLHRSRRERPLEYEEMTMNKFEDSIRAAVRYEYLLNPKDSSRLLAQLRSGYDLDSWLERACQNCQRVGNILAGNKEAVVYMNNILSVAVGTAVPIIWIFLVKLATIGSIAAIISSLAALAFIFGNTAKTLFEGMIFAFAVHPFEVGDICVINDTQKLEVRRLGIWKTVFRKQDRNDEEVIYPNSTLVNATIVKHKNAIDLRDHLEFYVTRVVNEEHVHITDLCERIKSYLTKQVAKVERLSPQVEVNDTGEKFKIVISFTHLIRFQLMSYAQFLEKKSNRISKFREKIMSFVSDYEKQVSAVGTGNIFAIETQKEQRTEECGWGEYDGIADDECDIADEEEAAMDSC